jgi:ligand-binding sensor domain-containing protein
MKKIIFILISVVMMGYTSCNKEKMECLPYNLPGTNIVDLVIDNNHILYFVTSEIDKSVEWSSLLSSVMPTRLYLSKKATETGKVDILDDRYAGGKLHFDKNNHLLSCSGYSIYRIDGRSHNTIFELPDENPRITYLSFIDVDKDNNIWTGGYQSGLFKIDDHLNVTHYHAGNSELPSNDIRDIHIDKNNDIWIVCGWTGEYKEIMKISNDQWTVYPVIPSNPNITSVVTDKNGHLWIGTGWGNEDHTLMRFDGTQWETVIPRNDKNEIVKGFAHRLWSDGRKLYIFIMRLNENYALDNIAYFYELLTFDGKKWGKVYDAPEDCWINDLIVDDYRQVVWVITGNKGLLKIPF